MTVDIAPMVRLLCRQDQELILQTRQAFADVDLPELVEAIDTRILDIPEGREGSHRIARLLGQNSRNTWYIGVRGGQLGQFAELLFRDLNYAATTPAWTPEMRRVRAAETITLAGF